MVAVLTDDRTEILQRRVRLLVGAVLVYNTIEAATAITAGALASSTALVGFGLDSIVEVTSALAITWQFAHHTPAEREHRALRIVGYSFFALAAYVTVDAVLSLLWGREAEHSSLGIGLAALSLVIMPIASVIERRTGEELGSASVVADSKQLLRIELSTSDSGLVTINTVWDRADPAAAAGCFARAAIDVLARRADGPIRVCGRPACNMRYLQQHRRRRYCNPACANSDRQTRFQQRHKNRDPQ